MHAMGRNAKPTTDRQPPKDRTDGRLPYHIYLNEQERQALAVKAATAGRSGADVIRRWLLGLRA